MAKHKTEKRLIEYPLENLPGETWKKEKGDLNTTNKTYYVSNKGRRKVVYYTKKFGLFDVEKKCYYDLTQKWERLSNNRRHEHQWNFLDDYGYYGIVTPDYYYYREKHGASKEELLSLIKAMYPNEF